MVDVINFGKIRGKKLRRTGKKREKEAIRKKKFSSPWKFWGRLGSLCISSPTSICLSGARAWDTHHVGDELASLPVARLADRIVLDVLEWRKRQLLTERVWGRLLQGQSVITCWGGSPRSHELCANGSPCALKPPGLGTSNKERTDRWSMGN